ncbi:hypothetical protein BAZSYMA_ACONTIG61346_3 [Bathymodiolus azoricus thioautotrophic gill symbiont]|uniref:Uncharacterized protein n=1 Tax=Bathymodiolus azoricus thioautotrophic gill symbiont TaxID=235205 RepID=A0A1H6LGR6_9GAMM|nr:hypothetical protein BAZSYMA_ACONTIG61346_3 [Bathymodiolus azoricus thioautotrophic gill symbiont]
MITEKQMYWAVVLEVHSTFICLSTTYFMKRNLNSDGQQNH